MLLTAMLPLMIAMGVALWHSTNQTTKLTINLTQSTLDTAAQKLSTFFSSRVAEISTYSQTSMMKTMDFKSIRPFLIDELSRHKNIYEKFILGTPEGYFYNTSGGNPDVKGLRTTNDRDPKAKPKHIRKRDYWQKTVGKNLTAQATTYVSDPMISYTTGAKQIVIASTILSQKKQVRGMIGGALPWVDIQERIKQVNNDVAQKLGWSVKFFLISNNGTYWYHWNPEKIVHLKLDKNGKPLINEIGEKEIVKYNINDEKIPEFASTGVRMINRERGHAIYTNPETDTKNIIVFSPIESSNYSIGIVIPKNNIMKGVNDLQEFFTYIFIIATIFIILFAYYVSRNISSPIISLNKMAKRISHGKRGVRLRIRKGSNEINELSESFNLMSDSLVKRENSLTQSESRLEKINSELEKRIFERTQELKKSNDELQQQVLERTKAQNSLKNRERLLKNTGELAHVGGWKLKINSNTLIWTEETYNIHNLPSNTPISIEQATNYFYKGDKEKFDTAIKQSIQDAIPFDLELQLVTKNKTTIWVRVICTPNSDNGHVTELLGAYQDIAELKKVEKLKSEFVSTVSHELRTPLTAIHGSLSIINSEFLNFIKNNTIESMLNIAERNSERLLLLINDLLDMEKIESGKFDYNLSIYKLKGLIEESVVDNKSYGEKFNTVIQVVTDIPDIEINVDKGRFFQVLSNLISNAAKFTKDDTSIDISISKTNDFVSISVSDYGPGISDEFKDKVFEKFSQADSSDTRKPGGTGLGLSISKSIIEYFGGKINYETAIGIGSRFYFTIPIYKK